MKSISNAILASQRDQEVFFNAIMNSGKPNSALKKAAARYKWISVETKSRTTPLVPIVN
jgi:uncharacterized protein (DUF1778 family)